MTRWMVSAFLRNRQTLVTRLVELAGVSALALLGLFGTPAWADVIYSYTGNNFINVSGSFYYTTADQVTVTMDLSSALGANFNGSVLPELVNLSMFDGVKGLTSTNPFPNTIASFATDGSGNITGWDVQIGNNGASSSFIQTVGTYGSPSSGIDKGQTFVGFPCCSTVFGQIVNFPGAWSVVPEPTSALLLAMGLAALAGSRRPSRLEEVFAIVSSANVRGHRAGRSVAEAKIQKRGRLLRHLGLACFSVVTSLGFVLGVSTPTSADVIYSYTGQPFTQVTGSQNGEPYTTADFVTVSMTLPNQIPPNQTDLVVTSELISLSMSDGVQTISLTSPNLLTGDTFAKFTTDSLGNITAWEVGLAVSDVPFNDVIDTFLNPGSAVNDIGEIGDNLGAKLSPPTGFGSGSNSNLPGTWSVVPEPDAAALMATGLVGLFAMGGARRRSGPKRA